jgi:hypothetical protein
MVVYLIAVVAAIVGSFGIDACLLVHFLSDWLNDCHGLTNF